MQLRDNDAKGLDQLFDRFASKLARFAYGYLRSYDDAEEVVQECFLKVWEQRHTFDDGILFKTYLFSTAYHQVLNQLRRQRTWVFEDYAEETVLDESSPSRVLEQLELEKFYEEALAQLPPRRRQMFTLSRQQGLSNATIAREMNVTVKCVENQMTHALKFLRLYFKAHGVSLALALLFFEVVK